MIKLIQLIGQLTFLIGSLVISYSHSKEAFAFLAITAIIVIVVNAIDELK